MRLLKKNIILFVALIFTALHSYADQEHFFNNIKGVHFAADSSVTVADDKYLTLLWSTIQKNISCTDVVTLQLNEDTALFLNTPHTCRVDLEIYYYLAGGGEDSVTKSLTISYDSAKGKPFNFRSSFKLSGGFKLKSKILAVYYDGSISTTFPKVFELNEDIYINRVYNFSCPITSIGSSIDYPNQKLTMSWTPEVGADEYDLEWTFYDDSSNIVKTYLTPTYSTFVFPDFNFLYKNNATRVTLNENSYPISLVYNPGYIFYRVRAAHYDTLGNRIEGPWTSDTSCTLRVYYTTDNGFQWEGHEVTMNWQYTAAYAEEGKRKEVSSYFDGSL
ncbi:MAG TPA: hypothetical protein VK809_02840, partial [Bacteroidia bacterium]|nr:hypothetical protein [Bacteroidia bacterium]